MAKKQRRSYWVVTYSTQKGGEKTVALGDAKIQKPKYFPSPESAARFLKNIGLADMTDRVKCVLCEEMDE